MRIEYTNNGVLDECNYPVHGRWTQTGYYNVTIRLKERKEVLLSVGSGPSAATLRVSRTDPDCEFRAEITLYPQTDQELEITRSLAFELWDKDQIEILYIPYHLLEESIEEKDYPSTIVKKKTDVMCSEEYAYTNGTECPYCGSTKLNPISTLESDPYRDGVLTQETECEWCDESWEDIYELTGWEEA